MSDALPDRSASIEETAQSLGGVADLVRDLWDTVDDLRAQLAEAQAVDVGALQDRLAQAEHDRDRALRRVDALEDAVGDAQADAQSARETTEMLRAQVESLTETAFLSRSAPPSPSATPETPPRPVLSVAPPEDGVVGAFVDWCRRGGGLVGRAERFEQALAASAPDATVQPVYRDSDSPARPVKLTPRPGTSPVQYWLVRHQGNAVVVPQPLNPAQFRELAPCFDGMASPTSLSALTPPTVRAVGPDVFIDEPGRIA